MEPVRWSQTVDENGESDSHAFARHCGMAPNSGFVTAAQHILIAGPGRAGTTLLVQLFGALGLETGAEGLSFDESSNAGLEADVLAEDAPRVVKDPTLTNRLRALLEEGMIDVGRIECVIVPLRNLDDAATSRIRNSVQQRRVSVDGGLFGTRRPRRQRDWLAAATYGLFETLALFEIPLLVLEYPRFATDCSYAFRRLQTVLSGCSECDFVDAWQSVVNPALVRSAVGMPRHADAVIIWLRLRAWLRSKLNRIVAGRRTGVAGPQPMRRSPRGRVPRASRAPALRERVLRGIGSTGARVREALAFTRALLGRSVRGSKSTSGS